MWFGIEEALDGNGAECSVGHTKSYVKVIVPRDVTLPGRCQMVTIHNCARFHIEGTVDTNQREYWYSGMLPRWSMSAWLLGVAGVAAVALVAQRAAAKSASV